MQLRDPEAIQFDVRIQSNIELYHEIEICSLLLGTYDASSQTLVKSEHCDIFGEK